MLMPFNLQWTLLFSHHCSATARAGVCLRDDAQEEQTPFLSIFAVFLLLHPSTPSSMPMYFFQLRDFIIFQHSLAVISNPRLFSYM